jgi:hypothetical protein
MNLFAFASLDALSSVLYDAPEGTDHVAILNTAPQQTTVQFYNTDPETGRSDELLTRTYDFNGLPVVSDSVEA